MIPRLNLLLFTLYFLLDLMTLSYLDQITRYVLSVTACGESTRGSQASCRGRVCPSLYTALDTSTGKQRKREMRHINTPTYCSAIFKAVKWGKCQAVLEMLIMVMYKYIDAGQQQTTPLYLNYHINIR